MSRDYKERYIVDGYDYFFCGGEIPIYFSHECSSISREGQQIFRFTTPSAWALLLIRFSKVWHERIIKALPDNISKNQWGFMKGKVLLKMVYKGKR